MLAALLRNYNQTDQVKNNKKISNIDYNTWRGSYVFQALKNQRYGQAFCNQFNITDNILFYDDRTDYCHKHILKYYIQND